MLLHSLSPCPLIFAFWSSGAYHLSINSLVQRNAIIIILRNPVFLICLHSILFIFQHDIFACTNLIHLWHICWRVFSCLLSFGNLLKHGVEVYIAKVFHNLLKLVRVFDVQNIALRARSWRARLSLALIWFLGFLSALDLVRYLLMHCFLSFAWTWLW